MYHTKQLLTAISARDLQAREATKWARRAAEETDPANAAQWAEWAADSRRMLKWWNRVISDLSYVPCKPSKAERKAMRLAAVNLGADSSNQLLRGTADGEQIAALPMDQFEARAYRVECLPPVQYHVDTKGLIVAQKQRLQAYVHFRKQYLDKWEQTVSSKLAACLPR